MVLMLFDPFSSRQEAPRFERQLENVEELVLHTIQEKKNVNINKRELHRILDALYEFRVID